MEERENYFNILNTVNLNDKKQEKGGLTYLSWAYAWGELKKHYPDATYKIYERDQEITTEEISYYEATKSDGSLNSMDTPKTEVHVKKTTVIPINYFTDGRTCWVKVGVTVNGIEHIEELPIMNNKNQSVAANAVDSTKVNKSIQRALTKAIARHGLGLYIYANEDLPDSTPEDAARMAVADDDLNQLRSEVIDLVTGCFGSAREEQVDSYIRELFGNVKLSQTTSEHYEKLQTAKKFLMELDK